MDIFLLSINTFEFGSVFPKINDPWIKLPSNLIGIEKEGEANKTNINTNLISFILLYI